MPIAGVLLLRVGKPLELGIYGRQIGIPASLKRCALHVRGSFAFAIEARPHKQPAMHNG